VRIARIRLSDKTLRLRPRHVVTKPAQAYEPEVPVEMREWIGPASSFPIDQSARGLSRPPAECFSLTAGSRYGPGRSSPKTFARTQAAVLFRGGNPLEGCDLTISKSSPYSATALEVAAPKRVHLAPRFRGLPAERE
jgi:hypothetical protein